MTAIKNPVQRMLRLLPLCLAALSLLLTSCKEQDDTVEEFPNWQHQNDVFYGRLVADAREFKASGDLHWDLIPSYSKPASGYAYQYYDYVVVEKLEDGEGTTSPLLTDTVQVHYVGKLIPSADKYKADGMEFDRSYPGVFDSAVATPSKLGVAGLINGFITAVMQMHKTIKTAMSSSGAEKLDGADEKMGARDFVAAALLSRCGKGGLANIRKALDSQNASALNEYYSFSDAGRNGLVENPSDDLKEGIKVVGRIGLTYLEKLDNAVNDNLRELNPGAHEESRVKKFEGEFDIDDFGGDELVDDTVSIANDINDELVQNFVDATVQGSGKGSEAIKNVIRTKLDGSNDPGEKLGKRLSANANAMMNWSIGGEMKKLAADGGESSQFKKDIVRNYNVTMSDGEKTFKLSNDFEKARDELAQFVTGDPKATYKGLAEAANKVAETAADKAAVQKAASDRNKVHLLMALISQETEKAGENGAEHAMDPREAEGAFTITGFSKHDRLHGIGADASRTFVVAKRADGGIDLNYTMDKPLKEVDDGTTDGDGYKVGDGSKFVCKLDYTLKGAEFNRLAQLDFGKFDDSEGKKIYDKKIDMPDGTRQFREHKLEKVVDSFPEEFKVKADCRMDFTLTLNPTDEEKIAAQRDAGPIVA